MDYTLKMWEWRYRFAFLTSALDGGVLTFTPNNFTSEKADPSAHCI
jgi:hypothetical protein